KRSILASRNSWGDDILSGATSSWYFSQNNYPNTELGNSGYTVKQLGCLVTSYAMIATFYGRSVSPATIAGDSGNFWNSGSNAGALRIEPPSPTGLSMSRYSIDWGRLDDELDAGRPAIISIYLPEVGALNSDGSSHWVVVYARDGDKYRMHDPLGGGRSYGFGQVKTLKVIRP
ncbi:MAG: C39 family peptidase, partial [Patescibacteria group bacterium]